MSGHSSGGSGSSGSRDPRRAWPYAGTTILAPLPPANNNPYLSSLLKLSRSNSLEAGLPSSVRSRRGDEPTRGLEPQRQSLDRLPAYPSTPGPQAGTIIRRQIKPTCLICLETPDRTNTWVKPSAGCTHGLVACKTCLREYIVHKITVERLATLICPDLGCRRVLEYSDVVKRIQDNKACLDHYNALIAQIDLEKQPNFVWCMNPSCDRGQIHREGAAVPVLICEYCRARSCFRHRVPWHSGLTCEQYTGLTKYKQENQASEEYIAKHAKRCPNPSCRRPILKIDGCDHMTCRRPGGCGHEFCWACLADYGPIRRLGNHLHGSCCPHYSGPGRGDTEPVWLDPILQVNRTPRDRRNVLVPLTRSAFQAPARPVTPFIRIRPTFPFLNGLPPVPPPLPPRRSPTDPAFDQALLVPILPNFRPRPLARPNVNPNSPRRPSPPPVPASPVNVPVIPAPVPISLPAPAPPSVVTQPPRRHIRRPLVSIRKEVSPFGKVQEALMVISSAAWWPVVYLLLAFMGLILRTGEMKVVGK